MQEQSAANGHSPTVPPADERDTAQDLRARIASEARELFAQESRRVDRLAVALVEAKAAREQARKVLDIVLMEPGQPKSAATPKSQQRPAGTSAKKNWTISERAVTKVLEAVRLESEPITKTELARKIKMSGDTIAMAFDVLREREQVRITGSTRGGGKLYLPMPVAEEELSSAA